MAAVSMFCLSSLRSLILVSAFSALPAGIGISLLYVLSAVAIFINSITFLQPPMVQARALENLNVFILSVACGASHQCAHHRQLGI